MSRVLISKYLICCNINIYTQYIHIFKQINSQAEWSRLWQSVEARTVLILQTNLTHALRGDAFPGQISLVVQSLPLSVHILTLCATQLHRQVKHTQTQAIGMRYIRNIYIWDTSTAHIHTRSEWLCTIDEWHSRYSTHSVIIPTSIEHSSLQGYFV